MKFTAGQAILALLVPAALSVDITGGRSPKCVCCSALANDPELEGKVLMPDTETYDKRLQSYYSANAAQAAWCMVLPTSTSDVSRIAKVISEHQCPFGIRSGAHSAFKGANGAKDGITVDFGNLNTTTYNNATEIASINPGSTWEKVFTLLKGENVTTVGGRASVVGVGGFVTGGGYSFHTNAYGFACDTVTNFEIVLANGTVVNTNATSNPDLFKAQKGGSGNLGFVTRIDQKVVNSTDMWGGLREYDETNRDKLFRAYLNFADKMDQDPASQNIVGMSYGTHRTHGLRAILTNSAGVDDAPAFSEYEKINVTSNTSRVAAVAEMVPEFTGPTPLGLYANWFVGQFRNDVRMMNFVYDELQMLGKHYLDPVAEEMAKKTNKTVTYDVLGQFQPFTQSMVKHGLANGGNILGLEDVVADGPTSNWLLVLTCDTLELQDKMLPFILEFRKSIDAYAEFIGVFKDWRYLNYAWGDQNPIATYGEKNVAFLKDVAKRVDPDGVFQKLRTTGFKIPVDAKTTH
ncbi:hypothetical protein K456DRAFT_57021 [Colletotrichum gloeosporioides 23]|nr:hypothetical protein K456DRAFT_57021 [Colletotrichum gloeosporioides 23]